MTNSNHASAASPSDSVLTRAVSKVKGHVLPLFVIMFILNYIDRVNIGFVRTHMEHDLGIGAAAYGLGAGLFFIGYALFEVPSNMLLQKVGARIWLTRIMFTWGIVATLMAFIQNETQFYILRFLLGVAEAGFFPGVIYYFTRWLPGVERGKAIAIFLSGSAVASLISGPLSGALLQIEGFGFHGWQWMFAIEGLASVALGFFVWFWLDSKPHDAKWLTREEQDTLVGAIDQEQREREALTTVKPTIGKLLKDRQILLFCALYFCIQLTIYAATFWLPSIIKKMGDLSDIQVGFFNSIPWSVLLAHVVPGRWRRPVCPALRGSAIWRRGVWSPARTTRRTPAPPRPGLQWRTSIANRESQSLRFATVRPTTGRKLASRPPNR